MLLAPGGLAAQDRIVLRNNKVLTGKVVAVSLDGVELESNKQLVGWDEVEAGKVGTHQARFDELLKDVGEPLYRVRRRLQAGDYRDLLAPAEAVYPCYVSQRSPTGYMVCQALMWSRLANGQREAALEPYLSALATLKKLNLLTTAQMPTLGARKLQLDPASGLTQELPPVWFDPAAAKAAWPGVRDLLKAVGADLPAGAALYGASLALAAGDRAAADKLLQDVPANPKGLKDLALVLAAQAEIAAGPAGNAVASLQRQLDELVDPAKPLAHYWLGLAALGSSEERQKKEGIVQLLHLPALFGDKYPDLAGAGIYHAARTLETLPDASAQAIGISRLRTELLTRYAATPYGLRLKAEMEAKAKPTEKPSR